MNVKDIEIVFISFDEPNAEENFNNLTAQHPKVYRIDGIEGFDKAHRAAARLVSGNHLFIVDGDNKVTSDFFTQQISIEYKNVVYSWGSKNIINGLIYGNGGIKLWPTALLKNISGHDNGEGVDWCHSVPYFQMNDWFSYTCIDSTPYQAFRAGFREGVKLSLDGSGKKLPILSSGIENIPADNLRRLLVWMSVGLDIRNGIYAVLGARIGFFKANISRSFDLNFISNYSNLKQYWDENYSNLSLDEISKLSMELKNKIQRTFQLPIADLNREQSRFYKSVAFSPARRGFQTPLKEFSHLSINQAHQSKSTHTELSS
jgi:hypothetical protein